MITAINGRNMAITMLPTINARTTIMMGSKQGGHGSDGIVHFFLVIVGDAQEHFRQGAGLFADVHHADDHGRKNR